MNAAEAIDSKKEAVKLRKMVNPLNDLSGKEWIPETISVFVQKGLGAGHEDTKIERQHPAPFSFQDVGRLISFFTKKNGKVLDPFCGVASTLKACAILDREGHGIELSDKYYKLGKQRLETEVDENLLGNTKQEIVRGDALKVIKSYPDECFDFIVTSPPYWNILHKKDHKVKQERLAKNLDTKYSNHNKDLGNIKDYKEFLETLSRFFIDCSRVLKSKKYLCVIVSDFRDKSKLHMFHADLANRLEGNGYALKGITILYQRHKKVYPYGYPYAYVPNIHHQYILIFQKNENK